MSSSIKKTIIEPIKRKPRPLLFLFLSIISAFIAVYIIVFLLSLFLPFVNRHIDALFITLIISLILFPILYIIQYRPLFSIMNRLNHVEKKNKELIDELMSEIAKVRILQGLIPICSHCKKVRDDKGFWHQVEVYIRDHSEAEFSHGLCPDCAHELYPELQDT